MRFLKITLLLILGSLTSCETDDEIVEVITNRAVVSINGIATEPINGLVSGNSNCDNIFLTIYNQAEGFHKTVLEIDLRRDGTLAKISYYEQVRNETTQRFERTYYYPPFYDLLSTITISNFSFDEITKNVYFEFEGTLYNERDDSQSIEIDGLIDMKNLYDAPCSIEVLTSLDYNSDEFSFNSIFWSRGSSSNSPLTHSFRSNNGFQARFVTDPNIGDLSVGTYLLPENSNTNYFELSEYNGPLHATQTPNRFDDTDWINYATRGSFTITDKIIVDTFNTKIIGYFDIEVLDQNQVIYTIDKMDFIINGSD